MVGRAAKTLLPATPRRRSRRQSWRGSRLVALDFETTGLDYHRDSVVSFGLVPIVEARIDLSGAIYREVAPPVDPTASSIRIHQLRPLDLMTAPRLEDLLDLLRNGLRDRYVLTWAAGVEIAFLRRTFGGGNRRWRSRTIDVRLLAAFLDRLGEGNDPSPASQTYSLEETADRFGVPVEQAHHALDDAFMTAELFLVVAAGLERHGLSQVRDFLHITNARRLAARYPQNSR